MSSQSAGDDSCRNRSRAPKSPNGPRQFRDPRRKRRSSTTITTFALLLLMFGDARHCGTNASLHRTTPSALTPERAQTSRWDPISNNSAADVPAPPAPHAGLGAKPRAHPLNASVHTERLEQALHQLLDRLQKKT